MSEKHLIRIRELERQLRSSEHHVTDLLEANRRMRADLAHCRESLLSDEDEDDSDLIDEDPMLPPCLPTESSDG